jgi:hypothetical protein
MHYCKLCGRNLDDYNIRGDIYMWGKWSGHICRNIDHEYGFEVKPLEVGNELVKVSAR